MKHLFIAVLIPLALSASGFQLTSYNLSLIKSCQKNAIVYGKLKGLPESVIIGEKAVSNMNRNVKGYTYGDPNSLVAQAVQDCVKQIKKYGTVWDMPFENEIIKLRKQREREQARERAYKKYKEDKNLLGEF